MEKAQLLIENGAEVDANGNHRALRAHLDETAGLSTAEKSLLREWLERLIEQ